MRQSDNMTGDLETEGAKELKLMLEVVDILDELNILILLFEKQDSVVSALPYFEMNTEHLKEEAAARVQSQKADTERLRIGVTQTHDLVS